MEFEKIRQIICCMQSRKPEDISLETSFLEDLSMDSLDMAQMVADIEDAFDTETELSEIKKIATVGDAVEYVKRIV